MLVVAGTGSTTVHEERAQTATNDRAAGTINFSLFISLIRRTRVRRLCSLGSIAQADIARIFAIAAGIT